MDIKREWFHLKPLHSNVKGFTHVRGLNDFNFLEAYDHKCYGDDVCSSFLSIFNDNKQNRVIIAILNFVPYFNLLYLIMVDMTRNCDN